MKKRHEQKLVLLSIALFVMLNIPLIFVFNSSHLFLGIPVFYFAIFCIWFFSIVGSYYIFKRYYE